jgi:hypothetical protein
MEWDWELGGADFRVQIGEERMEVRRQKSEDRSQKSDEAISD